MNKHTRPGHKPWTPHSRKFKLVWQKFSSALRFTVLGYTPHFWNQCVRRKSKSTTKLAFSQPHTPALFLQSETACLHRGVRGLPLHFGMFWGACGIQAQSPVPALGPEEGVVVTLTWRETAPTCHRGPGPSRRTGHPAWTQWCFPACSTSHPSSFLGFRGGRE